MCIVPMLRPVKSAPHRDRPCWDLGSLHKGVSAAPSDFEGTLRNGAGLGSTTSYEVGIVDGRGGRLLATPEGTGHKVIFGDFRAFGEGWSEIIFLQFDFMLCCTKR